jgi:hypothetical protein
MSVQPYEAKMSLGSELNKSYLSRSSSDRLVELLFDLSMHVIRPYLILEYIGTNFPFWRIRLIRTGLTWTLKPDSNPTLRQA